MKREGSQQWYFADELQKLIAFLNDGHYYVIRLEDDVRKELRTLIDEWLKARADWRRFLGLRLRAGKQAPFTNGIFVISAQAPTPFMIPIAPVGATEAEGIFQQFILNPGHRQLGGPCRRKDCGRFFLRETAHPKVYCTSRCASLDTAVSAMRKKREADQGKLVAAAKEAIGRWKRKALKAIAWEDWVAAQVTEWALSEAIRTKEVTARMVRGWVAKGYLNAPVKGKP